MNKFASGKISPGVDKDKKPQTPQLSTEYPKWRDYGLPNPSERSYRNILWRPSVLHGIVDAQNDDK